MAFSDYGVLFAKYYAVILASPPTGISGVVNGYNFGLVEAVWYGNETVSVGESVLFKFENAIQITLTTGDIYYMVHEKDLIFKGILL
jgi:hypothetical protein